MRINFLSQFLATLEQYIVKALLNTERDYLQFHSLYSQASPELAETITQMLTNHGPLVKARPSAAVVGIPFKRQGSLDAGLPTSLSGQVGEIKPSHDARMQLTRSICSLPLCVIIKLFHAVLFIIVTKVNILCCGKKSNM